MGALFESILEIIPPNLIAFLIAAGFIAAGVYIWTGGNDERARYDRATGAESRSYEAEAPPDLARRKLERRQ